MKKLLTLWMMIAVLLVFGISCSKEDKTTDPNKPVDAELTAGYVIPSGELLTFAYSDRESDLAHPMLYGPKDGKYRLRIPAKCIIDSFLYTITIKANITGEGSYGYDADVFQGELGVVITSTITKVGDYYPLNSFISYDANNEASTFYITSITENHVIGSFTAVLGIGQESVIIHNGGFSVQVDREDWE